MSTPAHSPDAPQTPARPRVLHVYKDYYPPVMGGVEMTINILAEGCRDEFDTTVLVNSGTRHNFEKIINGVRVVFVAESGRVASAPVSSGFVTALAREAHSADILHFHHPNPTGDLARYIARPSVPSVMTYHSDVVRQKWAMAAYGPLQNWQMKHCEVIMPTSPNYLESSKWLTRHAERCDVVPLGIRTEEFEKTDAIVGRAAEIREQFGGAGLVLFVGRLRYYKGLQFLLDAAPGIDGKILLAGTGPMEADLREQVQRIGTGEKVVFLGDISNAEKIACYYAADVFCMPSHLRSEAFGLSQVEAMTCGCPVVSCDIPSGVPYVNQDGVSGLTVPPCDPKALAGAINRILSDEKLKAQLGIGAQNRALSEFTAEKMCERVKAVYRRVLETSRAGMPTPPHSP